MITKEQEKQLAALPQEIKDLLASDEIDVYAQVLADAYRLSVNQGIAIAAHMKLLIAGIEPIDQLHSYIDSLSLSEEEKELLRSDIEYMLGFGDTTVTKSKNNTDSSDTATKHIPKPPAPPRNPFEAQMRNNLTKQSLTESARADAKNQPPSSPQKTTVDPYREPPE